MSNPTSFSSIRKGGMEGIQNNRLSIHDMGIKYNMVLEKYELVIFAYFIHHERRGNFELVIFAPIMREGDL